MHITKLPTPLQNFRANPLRLKSAGDRAGLSHAERNVPEQFAEPLLDIDQEWLVGWYTLVLLRVEVVVVALAFSSRARIFGECSTIHSPSSLFFFFLVETSSRTLIKLSRPGSVHSGSASWDDCDRLFPDELLVSSFPDRFPTLWLDSGIISPFRLRWVKGVCLFRWNLQLALLAQWPGSFTCHCGNTGVEWNPNKSQHTNLTLENKILPGCLPELESVTFWSWVWRSTNWTILTQEKNAMP